TYIVFFFQAEDGIRDFHVTGVQTCALPISRPHYIAYFDRSVFTVVASNSLNGIIGRGDVSVCSMSVFFHQPTSCHAPCLWPTFRSEERRVGKECRARRSA